MRIEHTVNQAEDRLTLGGHARWLCTHSKFKASLRLRQLLLYLVGRVERDPGCRVSQRDIALAVLALNESFNPSVDAHVRIEISRLRQALEFFYATSGEQVVSRIHIPKGSYQPVLRPLAAVNLNACAPAQQDGAVIALALLASDDSVNCEIAHLIHAEALYRCSRAPLVRAGALRIVSLPPVDETSANDTASSHGAGVVVLGRIAQFDGVFRAHVAVLDTLEHREIYRNRLEFSTQACAPFGVADAVASCIAAATTDALGGVVPKMLAARLPRALIGALMSAYAYIGSQDRCLLRHAMGALDGLPRTGFRAATTQALRADMLRVKSYTEPRNTDGTAGKIVDLAEDAICKDGENDTARLALGYGLLANSETDRAAELSAEILASCTTGTLAADARLLGLLATANGSSRIVSTQRPVNSRDESFLSEASEAIEMIEAERFSHAINLLARSRHANIYWFHAFQTVAYTAVGDTTRAQSSAQRVRALQPDFDQFAAGSITGFFPHAKTGELLCKALTDFGLMGATLAHSGSRSRRLSPGVL